MMKTKTWILILGALLVISLALSLWLFLRPGGQIANIYRDGVCILSIDLSTATEPEIFTFTDEAGTNVILVEPGRIRVQEADCPDQVCVKSGWLQDSAAPIVCLPHRLVIRLEASAPLAVDAIAR